MYTLWFGGRKKSLRGVHNPRDTGQLPSWTPSLHFSVAWDESPPGTFISQILWNCACPRTLVRSLTFLFSLSEVDYNTWDSWSFFITALIYLSFRIWKTCTHFCGSLIFFRCFLGRLGLSVCHFQFYSVQSLTVPAVCCSIYHSLFTLCLLSFLPCSDFSFPMVLLFCSVGAAINAQLWADLDWHLSFQPIGF